MCIRDRARAELKKRSTDTLRLQKKARKGSKSGELQRRVESSLQDVTERKHILEETEKKAVRAALIEERSRFCLLVAFLKPVVVIYSTITFLYLINYIKLLVLILCGNCVILSAICFLWVSDPINGKMCIRDRFI